MVKFCAVTPLPDSAASVMLAPFTVVCRAPWAAGPPLLPAKFSSVKCSTAVSPTCTVPKSRLMISWPSCSSFTSGWSPSGTWNSVPVPRMPARGLKALPSPWLPLKTLPTVTSWSPMFSTPPGAGKGLPLGGGGAASVTSPRLAEPGMRASPVPAGALTRLTMPFWPMVVALTTSTALTMKKRVSEPTLSRPAP